MSGRVQSEIKGMSYDFGIAITKGTVQALTATVAAVTALTASVYTLLDADDALVTMINKNQIAFGGYANTMKALAYAEKRAAEGIGFNTGDLIDGFKSLQRAGLNARKETDLVAKAAIGMGASFAQTAQIIQSGDFSALAEAGIISQRTAMSYSAMGFSAQQATRQVHALIKEANRKGMFDGAVQSMDSIRSRFKQFKNDFVFAIVGDPRDPEGLAFNVKKYLTQIADFINKHRNTIIYYGKLIGRTFRFVINVVGDFLKIMWKQFFGIQNLQEKSKKTMQDQLMSFGLWIEFLRVKIKMFFEDYGKYIAFAVKALLAFKAIKIGLGMWRGLRLSLNFILGLLEGTVIQTRTLYRYFRLLWNTSVIKGYMREFGGLSGGLKQYVKDTAMLIKTNAQAWGSKVMAGITSIGTGIASAATSAWAFTAALLANPITWIVAAVVALGAAIYYVVKNWDEFWYTTQKMGDGWSALLGPLFLIIKYWEEIKATATNVWVAIKGSFETAWLSIKTSFEDMKFAMGKIFDPFKNAIKSIKTFFKNYVVDPIQSFFNTIGTYLDKFANIFGMGGNALQGVANKGVDDSKSLATGVQNTKVQQALQLLQAQKRNNGGKNTVEQMQAFLSVVNSRNSEVSELKSSSSVAAIKEGKYAQMTADKIAEGKAGNTGASVDFKALSAPSTGAGSFGGNTVNINSGAVQINLGGASGMDENKIANLVEKKLRELMNKNKLREQG